MKKLSIFALAAVAALAACKKDDAANGDSTAVVTDTAATMTAPAAPMAPATTDSASMAAPATTDSAAMAAPAGTTTDTAKTDTTK